MENYMENTEGIRQCIIVTGMSGAGKTTTLKVLEDQGFFAIDNIPPMLLPQLFQLLSGNRATAYAGLAATIDIRSERLPDDFAKVISMLRELAPAVKVLFLNASDEALLSRFEQTRRRHPLGENQSVQEGIRRERILLTPVLENADVVIDTSLMDSRQFRERLVDEFCRESGGVSLIFTSFGFKYGVPQDSNYVFDVRFLPNPFYVAELKSLSGMDEGVRNYLWSFPETGEFSASCVRFLDFVIPRYLNTGKSQLHVTVGCTGGRHRSVAFVEWLFDRYRETPGGISVNHRDLFRVQALQ
ncbi:MAG: RNase adapter RapZ [Synergistaceae bacterium]|nr:RNase adapter RapZ [Synergistaceae bacterium]